MPHVVVKMMAGRSDELKARLADEVCKALVNTLGIDEKSVSVAVEDVSAGEWTEKVYKPEILGHPDQIYKKPGYDPF